MQPKQLERANARPFQFAAPATTILSRSASRTMLAASLALLWVVLGAAPSWAAVTLADAAPANAMTCASGTASAQLLIFNTPFKLSAPAGAATGDLLLLTIRTYNESNFLGNSVLPNAQSVAWTPLLSSGTTRTFYRRRLASDPAQYTVLSVGALVTASADVHASMVAFSGADSVTAFPNAGAQGTGSGTGSVTLPDVGVVRGGSMRYSAMSSDRNTTYNLAGAAPLTAACTQADADASVSTSYESGLAVGTTPSRTATLGGAAGPAWVGQTYVIQPALSPCASGGAGLTAPGSITFPDVTLTGYDQIVPTSATMRINDQTGVMAGWNLSATSTTFTNGITTLPTNATSIVSMTPASAAGICSLPTNVVGYPLTLPAGAAAPAASKLFNALVGTGSGPVDVTLGAQLRVPSNTRVGTYTSTWTLTLTSGP